MAAPRSRRARIMLNLKRQLETILISNTYATDIYKVSFDVKNWHQVAEAETPVLYLVDETTTFEYHPTKTLGKTWTYGIYGYMRGKDQIQMEEFIADIEDCLFRNITLSFDGEVPGPVSHMRIRNVTTDNQLFSEIEGSQLFKMTVDILFMGCVDNPR